MTLATVCRLFVLLAATSLLALSATAREISVTPGDFSLAPPDHWEIIADPFTAGGNTRPDNVGLPRFKDGPTSIDSVTWPQADTLDLAIDQYLLRLARHADPGEKISERSRSPFTTTSGLTGIRLLLRVTPPPPGGEHVLVRYIFRNTHGQIVCLGGIGDLDRIHEIVLTTLRLTPAP